MPSKVHCLLFTRFGIVRVWKLPLNVCFIFFSPKWSRILLMCDFIPVFACMILIQYKYDYDRRLCFRIYHLFFEFNEHSYACLGYLISLDRRSQIASCLLYYYYCSRRTYCINQPKCRPLSQNG
jgi:hypothetical protein